MDDESRGLLKLMLMLPGLRSELRAAFERDDTLRDLSGAYEEVTRALERLRLEEPSRTSTITEYEALRIDLENQIAGRCGGTGAS